MDVSIVIVSWKVKDQLEKCLKSVKEMTENLQYEVIVVDNDSQDGTRQMVASSFPMFKYIQNEKNLGFAYACNQAISISQGAYVLLLNPDTEVTKGAIGEMHAFMGKHPHCGIAGCKIKNFDGTTQPTVRRFPDLLSHVLILFKLHNFTSDYWPVNKYYAKDFDYEKTQKVDQVMGAFYLIKKEMLDRIGLFDENFFIWYEEVDLCKRALEAGWDVYYNHEVEVFHHKGSSFSQVTPLRRQVIFNRSLLYYFYKHKNIFSTLLLLLLYPISFMLSLVVQLSGMRKKRKDL